MYDPRHTALGRRALGLLGRRIWFIPRYPPLRAAHAPLLGTLILVLLASWFWARAGAAVRRASGRSLRAQWADLLWLGMRERIDPISYYLYELYLPQRRVAASEYLTRYSTKNGLFAALNNVPPAPYPQRTELTDKLRFAGWCERLGIPSPQVLLATGGGDAPAIPDTASLDCDLFVKRRHGSGARGTRLYRRIGPLRYRAPDGATLSLPQLLDVLRALGGRHALIVQRRLRNHPEMANLAAESLMVVRVMTCLDGDGQPTITDAMLRVLGKLEPCWQRGADAEWVAAVDVASGELGPLTGDAPETCTAWHRTHPITGAAVSGRVLPQWPAVRALALAAHHGFRDRTVIGWDIAITPDGPLVVEGNPNPDVLLIQRVQRAPLGHRLLGALLHAHFDRLEVAVPAAHRAPPAAPRRLQATALAGLLMAALIHLHMPPGIGADRKAASLSLKRAIERVESLATGRAIEATHSRRGGSIYTVLIAQVTQDVAFDIDADSGRIVDAVVRSLHPALAGDLGNVLAPGNLSLAQAVAAAERYTGATALEAEVEERDPSRYEVELSSANGVLVAIIEGRSGAVLSVAPKCA